MIPLIFPGSVIPLDTFWSPRDTLFGTRWNVQTNRSIDRIIRFKAFATGSLDDIGSLRLPGSTQRPQSLRAPVDVTGAGKRVYGSHAPENYPPGAA